MSEKVSGKEDIGHREGGILAEVAQGNVGIASMLQVVLERERESVRERERERESQRERDIFCCTWSQDGALSIW